MQPTGLVCLRPFVPPKKKKNTPSIKPAVRILAEYSDPCPLIISVAWALPPDALLGVIHLPAFENTWLTLPLQTQLALQELCFTHQPKKNLIHSSPFSSRAVKPPSISPRTAMASHIIGNRNSTPEASKSSLRPPSSSRTLGGSHQLRASADMSGFAPPLSARNIRPASEVYFNQQSQGQNNADDALDRAAQQWLADIDQYETTLEEMAAATLDQDFKVTAVPRE